MELNLDDEFQTLLLRSSLPDNWETLGVTLNNSTFGGKLTMFTVTDGLFNEEGRRKDNNVNNEDAFFIEGRGR